MEDVTQTTGNEQPSNEQSSKEQTVNNEVQNEQVKQAEQSNDTQPVDAFDSLYDSKVNEGEQGAQQEQQEKADAQPELPEDYSLTLEDGNAFEGDNAESFKALFKDAKLSQEQAQAMFSAYEKEIKEQQLFQQEQIKKMRNDWVAQVKADRELGGQNFNTTKLNIGRVMERYGDDNIKEFLNKSGLGLNPDFVRFINRVGAAIGNDTNFINGKGGAPTQRTEEERLKAMYPNSPQLFKR